MKRIEGFGKKVSQKIKNRAAEIKSFIRKHHAKCPECSSEKIAWNPSVQEHFCKGCGAVISKKVYSGENSMVLDNL